VTCEEFRALASSYALGALDADEQAAAEAHLRDVTAHDGCEEALRGARATVAALAGALPQVRPGERVWRSIASRASIDEPAPASPPPLVPRRALLGFGAAAAAILVALYLGERRQVARLRAELDAQRAVAALLGEPGSRVVELAPLPGRPGRAIAVVNLAARRAVVVSSSLAPERGKVYQLWVIRGTDAPVPAGFLRHAGGALSLGEIDPAQLATAPDALAVSLEPAGGSPTPTDVRLVGRLAG